MTLTRCVQLRGNTTLVERDPMLERYHDVLYLPFDTPGAPQGGLYDHGRKLVTAAGYFRASPDPVPHETYFTTLDPEGVGYAPDDKRYLFLGSLTGHYGHFIFASLSRLWALDGLDDPDLRLVILNSGPIPEMFRFEFLRELLRPLGISPERVVNFPGPVRFREILVPSPAIEEHNYSHRVFARMCNRIGDALLEGRPAAPSDTPAFLSKMRLPYGVAHLVNEDAFCERLQRRGVEIIFPETLPLPDQVALFRDRSTLTGMAGSAMHTSIFAPGRDMLSLNYEDWQLSNQALLDQPNDARTLCLYPHGGIAREGATALFQHSFRLADPARTADEFLRAMDRLVALGRRRAAREAGIAPPAAIRGRRNLSLDRPARQSSTWDGGVAPLTGRGAGAAVNGLLTGGYQVHTLMEEAPWWEVDLQTDANVDEVRLYNRLDTCPERANRIAILSSRDGDTWTELARYEGSAPFGGLDGRHLVWKAAAAVPARFVRVQLLRPEHLHLDQVEVFGTD